MSSPKLTTDHAPAMGDIMAASGVAFGTSGARGLVVHMTDRVCYAYTAGFLQYLEQIGELPRAGRVALAGDLRSSTERIMGACLQAIADRGFSPVHAGRVPTPALAHYAFAECIPSLMVTGSHIPDDRNGIKFYRPTSEVLKSDEAGMKAQRVALPASFDAQDMLKARAAFPAVVPDVARSYVARYASAFGEGALRGARVGLYGHSAVGRDLCGEILLGLGAHVEKLGYSERFIPVDTEAIRPEDVRAAAEWAKGGAYDAIVSTDGDSDRPLVSDERGKWLRGDIAALLTAKFLGATFVATPVSCNTAIERWRAFRHVERTRIGSPYVIEAMNRALGGDDRVVGYEANGGFLSATPLAVAGELPALPTRDAVIVLLAVLCFARREGRKISELVGALPQRFTASDRLEDFPTELSQRHLRELTAGGVSAVQAMFPKLGAVQNLSSVDGLRITFESGEIVHLRASGNAPELRCYTEADREDRAVQLNASALAVLRSWA
jgi:phosphomannomutase